MQVIGLPRQITRGAALASRLESAEQSQAHLRRDAVDRWRAAMRGGLNAEQAAQAVGVPKSTLYRWEKRPKHLSRRPKKVRSSTWSLDLFEAVQEMREDHPLWGKAKIAVVLRRKGWDTSESTVGRILKRLMALKIVTPVPDILRKASCPRKPKPSRPHAKRLPKGLKAKKPGELVQVDTLKVSLGSGRPGISQFNAADPACKWTCGQAFRRATAGNAARFLEKLIKAAPFEITGIQIDGGSEFMAEFEAACQVWGITLFQLPPRRPDLNGHVERVNSTWRYEFYACWDFPTDNLEHINRWVDSFAHEFNTYRPHQALGGQTPAEYLEAA